MSSLPAIIFGVLSLLSLVISIIGLVKSKTWLVVLGAVLFLPFVYYFGGSPATRIIIVLPFLHFGSAYALYKNNKMMAWSLFSCILVFVLFVAVLVLVYHIA